jgi:hypothetical protein
MILPRKRARALRAIESFQAKIVEIRARRQMVKLGTKLGTQRL